jgi:hypothetical protein
VRLDHTGSFPFAQGRRPYTEPSRQGAHERVAALLRYGVKVAKRGFDGKEGAVVEKLGVTFIDEPKRVLGGFAVDRLHDRGGRLVAVSGHERQERAQGLRVPVRVGAIAMRGAFGAGKNAGRFVVPDRLGGQTGLSRQVNRPELPIVLMVSRQWPANIAERFQRVVQRYR